MLLLIAKIITAAALFAPTIVSKTLFFPFISGKAIFFRSTIELALIFLLLHLILAENRREIFQKIKIRLKNPLVIAMAAFAGIFTLTALVGVNPTSSFWSNFERGEGAFQILHYFLFFLLVYLLFTDRKDLERLLKVQTAAVLYICGYALIQKLGLQNTFGVIGDVYRASGTLGNPSYLGAYLLLALPISAYFIFKATTWRPRIIWGAILLFEGFFLLNSGTRGAFLGLALGAGVIVVTQLFRKDAPKIRMICMALVSLMVVFGVVFATTRTSPIWGKVPILNRLLDLKSALHETAPRLWTWGTAVKGALEKPVFGWGAENFPYPFDKYYNPNHYGRESFFDRTHNIFLEYSISGGLVLLLAFFGIFYGYYQKILKARPKNFWRAILIATPIAYLAQAFFLFDVLSIYIAFYLFLAFAMNVSEESQPESIEAQGYSLNGGVLGIGMVSVSALLINLWITSGLPLQKNMMLVAGVQLEATNIGDAFRQYQKTLETFSPVGQEESIGMFMKFGINLLSRKQEGAKPEEIKFIIDTINKWFDENRSIMPGAKDIYLNGGLNIRPGVIYGFPEYIARGKKLYNEVLVYAPNRLEFMPILLAVAQYENDRKTYEELMGRLKTLRPDLNFGPPASDSN